MPSFSEQLKNEAEPIWRRIFDHPFLKEIKDGTLPEDTFRYYLAQDYLYLEGFGRTVAMALAKAPDSQTLQDLAQRVMTPVERPLHHKLLAEAGLTLADAQNAVRSPVNTAYVDHMLQTASLHGLGPTAAALLPCPWTYHLLKDEVGHTRSMDNGPASTWKGSWKAAWKPGGALSTGWPPMPGRWNWRPCAKRS